MFSLQVVSLAGVFLWRRCSSAGNVEAVSGPVKEHVEGHRGQPSTISDNASDDEAHKAKSWQGNPRDILNGSLGVDVAIVRHCGITPHTRLHPSFALMFPV